MLALVTAFHAIVDIQIRDCSQRFVIQTLQSQGFAQIFLKILDCFELFRKSRLASPAGSRKKLLETDIGETTDFLPHHDTGARHNDRDIILPRRRHTGNACTLDQRLAAGDRLCAESGGARRAHAVIETQLLRGGTAEEHRFRFIIGCSP